MNFCLSVFWETCSSESPKNLKQLCIAVKGLLCPVLVSKIVPGSLVLMIPLSSSAIAPLS